MGTTPISRRSLLAAAAAAGLGCLRLPDADAPAAPSFVSRPGFWADGFFPTPTTKLLVWRIPGAPTGHRKLEGFFVSLDETGSYLGRMGEALRGCASTEYYRSSRGFEEIAVLRAVTPGLEPWMFGRGKDGLSCRTGPGCRAEWKLVGRAGSGVAEYRYDDAPSGSVFVLPDRTWVYAMGSCEIRLANAFASNAAAPPRAALEPDALLAQWLAPSEDGWKEVVKWFVPFAGADAITGAVTATYAPIGNDAPALVRWLLPDAARAARGAQDFRLLLDANRRSPQGPPNPRRSGEYFGGTLAVSAEGTSIALRGKLPSAAVAAYVTA